MSDSVIARFLARATRPMSARSRRKASVPLSCGCLMLLASAWHDAPAGGVVSPLEAVDLSLAAFVLCVVVALLGSSSAWRPAPSS